MVTKVLQDPMVVATADDLHGHTISIQATDGGVQMDGDVYEIPLDASGITILIRDLSRALAVLPAVDIAMVLNK